MSYQAKILEDGRLVVPPEFGGALGLEPGDELNLAIEDETVRIDRIALLEQGLRKAIRKLHVAAEVDAFIEERRDDARREEEKWRRLGD